MVYLSDFHDCSEESDCVVSSHRYANADLFKVSNKTTVGRLRNHAQEITEVTVQEGSRFRKLEDAIFRVFEDTNLANPHPPGKFHLQSFDKSLILKSFQFFLPPPLLGCLLYRVISLQAPSVLLLYRVLSLQTPLIVWHLKPQL